MYVISILGQFSLPLTCAAEKIAFRVSKCPDFSTLMHRSELARVILFDQDVVNSSHIAIITGGLYRHFVVVYCSHMSSEMVFSAKSSRGISTSRVQAEVSPVFHMRCVMVAKEVFWISERTPAFIASMLFASMSVLHVSPGAGISITDLRHLER